MFTFRNFWPWHECRCLYVISLIIYDRKSHATGQTKNKNMFILVADLKTKNKYLFLVLCTYTLYQSKTLLVMPIDPCTYVQYNIKFLCAF